MKIVPDFYRREGYLPVWTYWALFIAAIVVTLISFNLDEYIKFCPPTANVSTEGIVCIEFWFNRYQTLIAGVFALLAAYIGLGAVRSQIASSERAETYRLNRSGDAARAVLPLALSALCDYAEKSVTALQRYRTAVARRSGVGAFEPPPFPSSVIQPLQDCVRTLSAEDSKRIVQLISFLQVFHARMGNVSSRTSSDGDYVYDAAVLYHMASELFAFARYADEDPVRPKVEEIRSALSILRIGEEECSTLERRLAIQQENERQQTND